MTLNVPLIEEITGKSFFVHDGVSVKLKFNWKSNITLAMLVPETTRT